MEKPKIILIGGGGHCKACIDVIETENKYQVVGILDIPEKYGDKVLDYNIIGNDNDIEKFAKQGYNFHITIGHLGKPHLRKKLFNKIVNNNGQLPVITSPFAHVSKHAKIEKGTIIMHNAIVNAGAKIGENCIINNKSLVEHDTEIGNNVHISTGTIINGNCTIKENCFIGSLSVVKQSVNISQNTIIGAGSVVTKDLTKTGVYIGTPAKRIK